MKEQLASLGITALQVLSPLMIALLGLLAKKLSDLIDARVKNETVKGILERLERTCMAAVTEVQQTFVDNLRPKAPKESLRQARDAALSNVKTLIGPKGLADAKDVLGLSEADVERLLVTLIESKVHGLKAAKAQATAATATATAGGAATTPATAPAAPPLSATPAAAPA